MDDMLAIRSIVNTLTIPSLQTRVSFAPSSSFDPPHLTGKQQEIILDMFFELLNIKTPEWFQTFIDGRRLTSQLLELFLTVDADDLAVYRKSHTLPETKKETQATERPHETLKLTDQYIALLLLILVKAGLLDVSRFL